ncbi:MAG TPA: hypothetical protein VMA74_11065 [Dyella sp.]|uniref:hypothetical protein n=1 Tax=Dyella sp. TaxID=1869338 RepID=UPI002C5ED482|nr:hypothetical protein [Dyella sp.]HUB90251.1 hypothetical protein [Dyella sp.]
MALADAGVPHPDLSNVTGSVVTPSTQTAQREAATLQRASLSLPSLPSITPTAAAPGTGVVGGWGGDGFSALDFGNGSPNANTLNPAQVAAAAPQAKAYLSRLASAPVDPTSVTNPAAVVRAPQASLANVQGAAQTTLGPRPSLVDQGVTLPGGRRLNYGAMVNGVPTFSDGGSGVPRTMTNNDIQNLGSRLSTYDHNSGPLTSDVLGYTPSTDQRVATLVRNMQDAGTGFTPSASDYARANAADVASGDWRSAAGTVAHNLGVDAQSGSGANRRAALQRLGQYTSAMNQADTLDQDAAAKSAQLSQQGQQALQQENLRGQYGLQEAMMPGKLAQLYRERHPLTLSDGSIATMDPITGQITMSTLPNGQPAKAFQPKDDAATKRADQVTDDLNKAALEFGKNFMPTKDKPAPTASDYTAWRTQAAKTMGLPTATNPKTGQSLVNINGQWVAL